MSDEIRVRIRLDESAIQRPTTRVYVQIPEVARTEYLLPAERYGVLKDLAWPEVLDVAQEQAEQGWALASPATSARRRVAEWLREPGHRAELQAAFEVDHARRHPVGRSLLAEIERLRARVVELEAERAALLAERHSTNESLDDAVQELRARQVEGAERPEGEHYAFVHHANLIPRDLPPLGGGR